MTVPTVKPGQNFDGDRRGLLGQQSMSCAWNRDHARTPAEHLNDLRRVLRNGHHIGTRLDHENI